jgi:hypothetical protein
MAMATCREGCGRPRRNEGGRTDPLCEECYRALLERLADEFREEESAGQGRRRYRRFNVAGRPHYEAPAEAPSSVRPSRARA